jgi:hypothetical protein
MIRIFIIIHIFLSVLFSRVEQNIDKKIYTNKNIYNNIDKDKGAINRDISILAKTIISEEKKYKKIINILKKTDKKIALNKLKLAKATKDFENLKIKLVKLDIERKRIETDVIDNVIEKYAMSMGIKQAQKESLSNIIDKEIYMLVFQNAKEEVFSLNINYLKVNKATRENQKKISEVDNYIYKQTKIKHNI